MYELVNMPMHKEAHENIGACDVGAHKFGAQDKIWFVYSLYNMCINSSECACM